MHIAKLFTKSPHTPSHCRAPDVRMTHSRTSIQTDRSSSVEFLASASSSSVGIVILVLVKAREDAQAPNEEDGARYLQQQGGGGDGTARGDETDVGQGRLPTPDVLQDARAGEDCIAKGRNGGSI